MILYTHYIQISYVKTEETFTYVCCTIRQHYWTGIERDFSLRGPTMKGHATVVCIGVIQAEQKLAYWWSQDIAILKQECHSACRKKKPPARHQRTRRYLTRSVQSSKGDAEGSHPKKQEWQLEEPQYAGGHLLLGFIIQNVYKEADKKNANYRAYTS